MNNKKEIEKLKLIIAENMAAYSKAQLPYEDALRACAVGILASGIGDKKQVVKEFMDKLFERSGTVMTVADTKVKAVLCSKIKKLFTELYGAEE